MPTDDAMTTPRVFSRFAPVLRLTPASVSLLAALSSWHGPTGNAPHQDTLRARLQRHGHRLLRSNGHRAAGLQGSSARIQLQPNNRTRSTHRCATCLRLLACSVLLRGVKESPSVSGARQRALLGLQLRISDRLEGPSLRLTDFFGEDAQKHDRV